MVVIGRDANTRNRFCSRSSGNEFFLLEKKIINRMTLFSLAIVHASRNHCPLVLRATTVEPIIHVAEPSNPKRCDNPSVPRAAQKSENTTRPPHYWNANHKRLQLQKQRLNDGQ